MKQENQIENLRNKNNFIPIWGKVEFFSCFPNCCLIFRITNSQIILFFVKYLSLIPPIYTPHFLFWIFDLNRMFSWFNSNLQVKHTLCIHPQKKNEENLRLKGVIFKFDIDEKEKVNDNEIFGFFSFFYLDWIICSIFLCNLRSDLRKFSC